MARAGVRCRLGALVVALGTVSAVRAQLRSRLPDAGATQVQASPSRVVDDARTRVRFQLPAGWELSRRDGEVSTFRLDARTARQTTELRAVGSLGSNPYPRSTFSGAFWYLSVTPHTDAAACAAQAHGSPMHGLPDTAVGDVRFSRGHDEHGGICTEARDEVYTSQRAVGCVRFDLVVNNFCGGEVSGSEDLSAAQLRSIQDRLEAILSSVRFSPAR